MLPRATVLEIFSTFAQFRGDRFEQWIADRRLVRSMERQKAQKDPQDNEPADQSEGFWALLWFQQWQQSSHPQAAGHLCAYLQEPCYWAAENVTQRFVNVQYSLADGFQVAISGLDRILSGYSPAHGSSLKNYARSAFGNLIRNQLRQQKAANICSDWGLLRKLSQIQLKQSLLTAGFAHITGDLLIWKSFTAVCTPDPSRGGRALRQPEADQLAQIADRYNQQRAQSGGGGAQSTLPKINSEQVIESLQRSAKAARAYLNPSVTSLNKPQYGEGKELLDDLTLTDGDSPMADLLAAEAYAEQQQKMQAIGGVLINAITQLDPPTQTLLILYYQQNLTQKDIANQLQIKQYQVSRKLSRVRQQLLLQVAQWSQDALHISIESDVLAHVSDVIHEWLQRHYATETQSVPEISEIAP